MYCCPETSRRFCTDITVAIQKLSTLRFYNNLTGIIPITLNLKSTFNINKVVVIL